MKSMVIFLVILSLATGRLYANAVETPPPVPSEEQPEVLTRGPVHEAFAEPIDLQSEPGLIAPTQPPANIVEKLPTERPAGAQFVWVPGYWAWDNERNDYIWVSGCWCAAPPATSWIPGYWAPVPQGWQWVPGFWMPTAQAREIEYLPAPPAVEDTQPQGTPSPDTLWVPACWYWYQGQYLRRPGYWLAANPDWVWMPSHYIWTPRGYVFVGGYWDYALDHRGVLFAPVYFPRSVYQRHGYTYTLGIAIDTGSLQFSLFTCPRYRHYYFGDYYDDAYIGFGIYPWFAFDRYHTWIDPIYVHQRWHFGKTDPHWDEHQRNEYARRRDDKTLRPARTYRAMQDRLIRLPESQRREVRTARPFNTLVTDKTSALTFERQNAHAQNRLSREINNVRSFRERRSRWESPAADRKTAPSSGTRPAPPTQPNRVKVPHSPVTGAQGRPNRNMQRPPSQPDDEKNRKGRTNRSSR